MDPAVVQVSLVAALWTESTPAKGEYEKNPSVLISMTKVSSEMYGIIYFQKWDPTWPGIINFAHKNVVG